MFVCLSCKEVESGVQARPFWFEPHSRMDPAWCSIHATTSDMFALHHSCLVCTQSAQHVCTLESGFSPRPARHGYLCQMGPRAPQINVFWHESGFSPRPACHGYLCQMGPRARPKSMICKGVFGARGRARGPLVKCLKGIKRWMVFLCNNFATTVWVRELISWGVQLFFFLQLWHTAESHLTEASPW